MAGYQSCPLPQILATEVARDLVLEADANKGPTPSSLKVRMLADVVILDPATATSVDLGGRSLTVMPRKGHTPSDVTVEIGDPSIVFCGDLVWNRMFPNYRDAIPSLLSRDVRALVRNEDTTYVPGQCPMAESEGMAGYLAVIDQVEAAAKRGFNAGVSARDAAQEFSLTPSLGEWHMFSPRYYEVALSAWERELKGSDSGEQEVSRG